MLTYGMTSDDGSVSFKLHAPENILPITFNSTVSVKSHNDALIKCGMKRNTIYIPIILVSHISKDKTIITHYDSKFKNHSGFSVSNCSLTSNIIEVKDDTKSQADNSTTDGIDICDYDLGSEHVLVITISEAEELLKNEDVPENETLDLDKPSGWFSDILKRLNI